MKVTFLLNEKHNGMLANNRIRSITLTARTLNPKRS